MSGLFFYGCSWTNTFSSQLQRCGVATHHISKRVKGLCSKVALLFAPEPDPLWIIPLWCLLYWHRHTHIHIQDFDAYNRFCASSASVSSTDTTLMFPPASCGQIFCQQEELKCLGELWRWKKTWLVPQILVWDSCNHVVFPQQEDHVCVHCHVTNAGIAFLSVWRPSLQCMKCKCSVTDTLGFRNACCMLPLVLIF